MPVVKVFVSGRSGSGKTTVIDFIKLLAEGRGWVTLHMRDYHILYEMYQEDIKKNGGRFKHAAYEGFEIIDYTAFDDALKELEKQVRKKEQMPRFSEKNELLLVEFARSNYREALKTFNKGFLQDAYFFYIEADVNTCVQRIEQRVASSISAKRLGESHYVPEEILRTYFAYDDWDYMTYQFKDDFKVNKEVVAYRNAGSYVDLLDQIEQFMEIVFKNEVGYSEQSEGMEKKVDTGELEGAEKKVNIGQEMMCNISTT